ncbi:GDP-mannose 4,6-dehydratase [Candidatus Woesearchaeota archaeon]|nr:GDP-mannose 4,6-dehydratase [Candidatus Woesearchaeota archaeon]
MKRALITGITGQDGAYLAEFLLKKGYKVFGIYRRSSTPNFWRLQSLGVLDKVTLIPADLADMASLLEAITLADPQEIYNLAAQSYVGASFDQPLLTTEVDGSGCVRLLEIIRHLNKDIKFYQASTSEIYGTIQESPQNEQTRFWPNSPYAAAKLFSFHNTRLYRESYGIFACNGILFNHESPLRGLEFVTRKITNAVARIKLGLQKKLILGNLEARRDWGYAPEYIEAMWMMLQSDKPEDYVVATGETHSVEEFAEAAFAHAGLKRAEYMVSDESLLRPHDVNFLCGDPSSIKKQLGWKQRTSFVKLVQIMVDADIERWEAVRRGKSFPWDAPNYADETNILKRHFKKNSFR